jgi:hypothetical protein
MMLSRWKIVAGMFAVSVGGLAALICLRTDGDKGDNNPPEMMTEVAPTSSPLSASKSNDKKTVPAAPTELPIPAKPIVAGGLQGTPIAEPQLVLPTLTHETSTQIQGPTTTYQNYLNLYYGNMTEQRMTTDLSPGTLIPAPMSQKQPAPANDSKRAEGATHIQELK